MTDSESSRETLIAGGLAARWPKSTAQEKRTTPGSRNGAGVVRFTTSIPVPAHARMMPGSDRPAIAARGLLGTTPVLIRGHPKTRQRRTRISRWRGGNRRRRGSRSRRLRQRRMRGTRRRNRLRRLLGLSRRHRRTGKRNRIRVRGTGRRTRSDHWCLRLRRRRHRHRLLRPARRGRSHQRRWSVMLGLLVVGFVALFFSGLLGAGPENQSVDGEATRPGQEQTETKHEQSELRRNCGNRRRIKRERAGGRFRGRRISPFQRGRRPCP